MTVVVGIVLGGWDVPDRFEESGGVEPVDLTMVSGPDKGPDGNVPGEAREPPISAAMSGDRCTTFDESEVSRCGGV